MTALSFVLVALAAFRTWKLLGDDTILDRPRQWVCRRIGKADVFLTCPWCAGFWISLGWAAAWWAHEWAVYAAVPFAVSALVGVAAVATDRFSE